VGAGSGRGDAELLTSNGAVEHALQPMPHCAAFRRRKACFRFCRVLARLSFPFDRTSNRGNVMNNAVLRRKLLKVALILVAVSYSTACVTPAHDWGHAFWRAFYEVFGISMAYWAIREPAHRRRGRTSASADATLR
jgi:hypothetical protein